MDRIIYFGFILLLFCEAAFSCSSMFGKDDDEITPGAESCTATEFYHEPSARCYNYTALNKEQGPCGNNMVLVEVKGSVKYVKCDCRRDGRAPFIYHGKTNQCYELYSQGPCGRHKWIELEGSKPKCAHNPCVGYHSQLDQDLSSAETNVGENTNDDLVVWFMNACTTLGRPCTLPLGSKLGFLPGKSTLGCVRPVPTLGKPGLAVSRAVGAIGAASCPRNQYRTPDGRGCQEAIEFDFL